jgi:hypothetical protein
VFSYGVVLLEIISGRKAIDICRALAFIVDWAIPLIEEQCVSEIRDGRISFPTYMEATIRQMLCITARCVSSNEEVCPSIGEIMENLAVQQLRFPIWLGLLRTVMLLRRRQKLVSQRWQTTCVAQGDVHSRVSSGS